MPYLKNKTVKKLFYPYLLLISLFLVAPKAFSQGDLLIFPKRLVFENTQNRVQVLNLHNNGRDTATYKISYVENRMTEDGTFQPVETPEPGQSFASPNLRFYPRTITLAPGETQVVKVQLVRTNDLEPGEYRSHLYFRGVPETKIWDKESTDPSPEEEGINIELTPVYGISIANIIRIGDPAVDVKLSNLEFEEYSDQVGLLNMVFTRSGEASSYGDIKVFHTSTEGKETLVGKIQGFAVYAPGKSRKAKIELHKNEETDLSTGNLKVVYVSQNGQKILAEGVLHL